MLGEPVLPVQAAQWRAFPQIRIILGEAHAPTRPGRPRFEAHRHHAVARPLHPPVPVLGMVDVGGRRPFRVGRPERRQRPVARELDQPGGHVGQSRDRVFDDLPAVELRKENRLHRGVEPRQPHADQPHRPDRRGVEREAVRHRQQRLHVLGGVGQRFRARVQAQIGQSHFDGDGAGAATVGKQPAVRLPPGALDGRPHLRRRLQVARVGVLGGNRLRDVPFLHRPIIDASGQQLQRRPDRAAERDLDVARLHGGEIRDGCHALRLEFGLRHGPDSPQLSDGKRVQQFVLPRFFDDVHAIRLRQPGADFGELLSRPRADRRWQPRLVADVGPQLLRPFLHRRRIGADEFGGLHERLVDAELLDDGDALADDREHPAGYGSVDALAGADDHRARRHQPAGLHHRHGGMGAVGAGLVRTPRDHPAAADASDQDGAAPQGRPGQLFDGRVERVHVDVQDPAMHDRPA